MTAGIGFPRPVAMPVTQEQEARDTADRRYGHENEDAVNVDHGLYARDRTSKPASHHSDL
jgi:hypothetical protein